MESKSFTLPSTPKLKKSNFSSSLISGATKLSPKINTSRIRISRPALARRIDPEAITPQQSSIENTLVETNKILVEIQKQLALDFAMRAREEKEERDTIRRDESRKKLKAEESLLEKSARKLGKGIKKTTDKIISPIKNVFDQILNFLTLVGAGIAANAAFEWLKDPENRKQLDEWFGWVADNWEWVAGITAGVLLLQPILNIVGAIGGAITIIKAGFDIFTFIRKRLFGGAKPRGGSPKPGAGTPKPNTIRPVQPRSDRSGNKIATSGRDYRMQLDRVAGATKPVNLAPKYTGLRGFIDTAGKTALRVGNFIQGPLALVAGGVSAYNRLEAGQSTSKSLIGATAETIGGFKGASLAANATLPVTGPMMLAPEPLTTAAGALMYIGAGLAGGFLGANVFGAASDAIVDSVEKRERGGPITAGKPYLVGEGGPELVVPKISGTVINNMKTEKIYQMISSDIGEGKINMIELPPITNQLPPPEIPVPSGPASEVPDISSINIADPYRILSPSLYGITV